MATVTVNIHEAKTHLSRLLVRAEAGERIVIARAGRPIATLEPFRDRSAPRVPGRDKGRVIIGPDFDEPLPEFDPDYAHPEDPLLGRSE
jgi:prevent-host-death family protein